MKRFLVRYRIPLALVLVLGLTVFFGWKWAYSTLLNREARGLLARSQLDSALEILLRSEELQPHRGETAYLLARAYRRIGELEKGTEYLERASQKGWNSEEIRHQRFLTLVQLGAFKQAEPYLNDVLQKNCPDDLAEEIYEAISRGYISLYRFNDALLCLSHWLSWRPGHLQARRWELDIWERMENWSQLRASSEAGIKHHPNDLRFRQVLARCHLHSNELELAQKEFERCLEIDPQDVEARLGLARVERRNGNIEKSRNALGTILEEEISPNLRYAILVDLAQLEMEARREEVAYEQLQKAFELDPHDPTALKLMNTVCLRLKKTEEAEKYDALAKGARERLDQLSDVTLKIVKDPENPELRLEAGKIMILQGLRKEGLDWLKSALYYSPNHAATHLAMADYYAAEGDKEAEALHRSRAEGKSAPKNGE